MHITTSWRFNSAGLFILTGILAFCACLQAGPALAEDTPSPAMQAYQRADYKTALRLWRHHAAKNDPEAQFQLAELYRKGHGVKRDAKKAFRWYNKAARQGHLLASYNLARAYRTNQGVKRDDKRAAYWYQQAADQGHALSQLNYGILLENGWGVERNIAQAKAQYSRAASQGNQQAQTRLDALAGRSTSATSSFDNRVDLGKLKPDQALRLAIADGQIEMAMQLLKIHRYDLDSSLDFQQNTALLLAARHGRTRLLKQLVESGASVEYRNRAGQTALYLAAEYDHKSTLLFLLQHTRSSDQTDNHGVSPLLVATQAGHVELATLLLNHGANIHHQDKQGWSALTHAIRARHPQLVSVLLKNSAHLDLRDKRGLSIADHSLTHYNSKVFARLIKHIGRLRKDQLLQSFLLHSIRYNHVKAIRQLLEAEANSNHRDSDGLTPLMHAARLGHADILKQLLRHSSSIDAMDNQGRSALIHAILRNCIECVKHLLQHKIDVNAGNHRPSPLLLALQLRHRSIARILLANQNTKINVTDEQGHSPLTLAAFHGWLDLTQTLVEREASLNHLSNQGLTALDYANSQDHQELAQFLISQGAISSGSKTATSVRLAKDSPIRSRSPAWNAIQLAAWQGNMKALRKQLRSAPELVNTPDSAGNTPLHLATQKGHDKAIRLLLSHKARVTTRNHNGETVLHVAARTGQVSIIKLLLKQDKTLSSIPNRLGRSPVMLAIIHNQRDASRFLLNHVNTFGIKDKKGKTIFLYLLDSDMDDLASEFLEPRYMRSLTQDETADIILSAIQKQKLTLLEDITRHHVKLTRLSSRHADFLFSCIRTGNIRLYRFLLKQGVAVNATDSQNNSALHVAASSGQMVIARHLLSRGIEVDVENSLRDTPLIAAVRREHLEVARLLIQNGADPRHQNRLQESPRELAKRLNRPEFKELLD